jgi:hypothetical protein
VKPAGVVTLLTDFGPGSVYVGQMHAVLLRTAPAVRVVDLAHDCPFAGIESAAYVLQRSYPHFPPGTVHVVVVDPGVGSGRAILAVRAAGHVFLAPDNGVLAPILLRGKDLEVRHVENRALMNEKISSTFHGRDIFAPVAARLASGTALAEVGPAGRAAVQRFGPVEGERVAEGKVLLVDRFGNLITNVPRAVLDRLGGPLKVRVRIGAAFINGLVETFSDVPKGLALAYVGSGEHLEIAVNGGRASDLLGLGVGAAIRVEPM